MKQYQHLAALANVTANDMDLYDTFADHIVGPWGYPEMLGDITLAQFWESLAACRFRLSDVSAMIDDFKLSLIEM
jgi:hypothetical protein